jgi:hypothetical protein
MIGSRVGSDTRAKGEAAVQISEEEKRSRETQKRIGKQPRIQVPVMNQS